MLFYSQIMCISETTIAIINEYKGLTGQVEAAFQEVKDLGGLIINDMKVCVKIILGFIPTAFTNIMKNQC